MAFWYLRPSSLGGDPANGKGFNSSFANSGSVNYANQATPDLILSDVMGTGGTTLTSVVGGFNSSHVGNSIHLHGYGYRWIVSVTNSNTVIVHANVATNPYAARVGGAGRGFREFSVGGNCNPTNPAGFSHPTPSGVVGGDTVYVLGSASAGTTPFSLGMQAGYRDYGPDLEGGTNGLYYTLPSGSGTLGQTRIVGINSPTLANGGIFFYNNPFVTVEGVSFFVNGGTHASYGLLDAASGEIVGCACNQNGYAAALVTKSLATNCWFGNTGSQTPSTASFMFYPSSYSGGIRKSFIENIRTGVASLDSGFGHFDGNIIKNCQREAFYLSTSLPAGYQHNVRNNTIYDCLYGLRVSALARAAGGVFENNLIVNCKSGGAAFRSDSSGNELLTELNHSIRNNVLWGNTTNYSQIPSMASNSQIDPMFAGVANNDFTPTNPILKGKGFPEFVPPFGSTRPFRQTHGAVEFASTSNSVGWLPPSWRSPDTIIVEE